LRAKAEDDAMARIRLLVLIAAAVCAQARAQVTPPPPPPATPPPGMSQGELLYTTHCIGCHTTEIHWREKKIAKDWRTLVAEVRRWQTNIKLNWGNEEIGAVAHYLNGAFYHFQEPEEKKIGNAPGDWRVAGRD
jgi:mono/diheme cytochrome c family protein